MAPLNEDVIAEIYREHGSALRPFVGRTSIDHARVDDVVQETVLRVWKQAPEVASMRAYLFQTARYIFIDRPRSRASSLDATSPRWLRTDCGSPT